MFKKISAIIFIIMLFSITVFASDIDITADGFTEYNKKNSEKVLKIVGLSEEKAENYLQQNNIIYFAVNSDNSKQITVSENADEFSKKTENLSEISDKNIKYIMSDLTGKNIKGKIIDKDSQKFVYCALKTSDSGGEYYMYSYFTVAGGKKYILTIKSNEQSENGFENIFKTFNSDKFTKKNNSNTLKYAVIIAIGFIGGIALYIVYTLIRDFKKK